MAAAGGNPTYLWRYIAGVIAVLAVGALAISLWPREPPPERDLDLPAARPAVTAPARPETPLAPLRQDPPAPGQIEALLAAISKAPTWGKWLAEGDAIRRWAIVLDNLADDHTPRKQLGFAAPDEPFTAETVEGHLVPTEKAHHRYDAFTHVISSVDAQAFATAYRVLHPALEATWRGLGYPGGSVDARAAEALKRIIDAPSPASVDLVAAGKSFLYADPELESLGPVEKHLLRMGRKNQRALQQKARELLSALHMSAAARR